MHQQLYVVIFVHLNTVIIFLRKWKERKRDLIIFEKMERENIIKTKTRDITN
jgi:hypothetical protein